MDLLRFEERSTAQVTNLLPPFWSVLRKSSDAEAKAILETETFFNKIYEDIRRVHRSLDLQTSDNFLQQDLRSITIRRFKDGTDWTAWDSKKKTYLANAGFVQVSGDNLSVAIGLSDADTLKPERTTTSLARDVDFFFNDETLYFITDPFAVSTVIREGTILPPWKKEIEYEEITLEGNETTLTESVLFNTYGFAAPDISGDYFSNTALYRVFLTGLYNIMYRGASDSNINAFASALAGTPFIKTDGETVIEITEDTVDGLDYTVVVTNKDRYYVSSGVSLSAGVMPGRRLSLNFPIAEYVTVYSYASDPEWVDGEIAGDTLIKSDSDDWSVAYRLTYELTKGTDAETVERFDMGAGSDHRPRTIASGIWHDVTGPLYYLFLLKGDAFTDEDIVIFTNILRELLPLNIIFDVVSSGIPEGALLSSNGNALLGSTGDVLLGTDL